MKPKLRALPYLLLLLPLDLMVSLILCASVPLTLRKNRAAVPQSPDSSRATIIIVNWDGKHLLAESLPAVIEAVRHDGRNHEILVVDNGSMDGSVDFVQVNFPSVRVLALDQNYGFIGGNNRGMALVQTEIAVLLNNDMIVEREFLRSLLDGFSDPSVFAVTSQIFFADSRRRREETGKTRARFQDGFYYFWHDEIRDVDAACHAIPVFWAGGGSCAIDCRKYRAIGGLDSLYRPFYVEDADVSYQAWKRGWKCLLAPASRVVHKHRSTTAPRFGEKFVESTIRKNQFLFVWKNLTDFSMLVQHFMNLPRIHFRAMLAQTPAFEMRAFLRAVLQLPEALNRRFYSSRHYVIGDREVLARSQSCLPGASMK